MAKQRSRIDRLKDGDRNTALYHAKAWERGRTNAIKSLVRDDGSVAETQEELEEVAVSYKSLFTKQDDLAVDDILRHVQRKVTASLMRPYTAEIKKAVFMMGPCKHPARMGSLRASFRLTGI